MHPPDIRIQLQKALMLLGRTPELYRQSQEQLRGRLAPADQAPPVAVAWWLIGCWAAVLVIVVIGGITRLTESGLSMTEWRPLIGSLPPFSDAEWQRVFDLYRQTPEYQQINRGMDLDQFREIFWWEYIHRLWGRLIGLLFAGPFVWFFWKRQLNARLASRLFGLLILGGLQGLIGWWMVTSGLVERTDVSQYRLAVHLGMAFLIMALLLWTALPMLIDRQASRSPPVGVTVHSWFVTGSISIVVISGAFVAGINAGMIYNSFPLMGGALIPSDYGFLSPAWLNPFENPAAVQFNHRWLAILTVALIVWFWFHARREILTPLRNLSSNVLLALALVQTALGIATLLSVVALPLAVLHQLVGALLFSAAVVTTWLFLPARRQSR